MLRQFARARRGRDRERAAVRARARIHRARSRRSPEIAREFGAILNLDELLTRIANLTRRVIDYRTFGILLLNEETRSSR